MNESDARTEMESKVEEAGHFRSSAGMLEGICPVCKFMVVSGDQKRYQVFDGFRRVLHEDCT